MTTDYLTFSSKSSHTMYSPTLTVVGSPATTTDVILYNVSEPTNFERNDSYVPTMQLNC